MPLIYGEGKAHAVRRLKNEIDAKSRDDAPNRQGGTSLAHLLTTSLMVGWKWKLFLFCVFSLGLAMSVNERLLKECVKTGHHRYFLYQGIK
jgi:hypothetical protein